MFRHTEQTTPFYEKKKLSFVMKMFTCVSPSLIFCSLSDWFDDTDLSNQQMVHANSSDWLCF